VIDASLMNYFDVVALKLNGHLGWWRNQIHGRSSCPDNNGKGL
jgi:hypothetical protein